MPKRREYPPEHKREVVELTQTSGIKITWIAKNPGNIAFGSVVAGQTLSDFLQLLPFTPSYQYSHFWPKSEVQNTINNGDRSRRLY